MTAVLSHVLSPATPRFEALVYVRQGCSVHVLPTSGTWRIGRGPENEIRVDDQLVSRHHLALHFGSSVEVEDLGSANGSLLFPVDQEGMGDEHTRRSKLEQRLRAGERHTLAPGDLLRVGIALLVIQPHRPAANPGPRGVPRIAAAPHGPAVLLDPEMKRVYDVALRAAQSSVSVLITGETGSGKEVFAETIHQFSNRSTRPFLRLNCAALPQSLLESELFGHERGAFTGAHQAKAGLLEATDQGTVFLDEVGEMPLYMQAKLLRVLEEHSVLRIGSSKPRPLDVRFIWATNRDLREEARAGRFRNDLFYRIAGVEFAIPPLRRRRSEIEPLARLFLGNLCQGLGIPVPELSASALAALQDYSWPGNVRELKNVMERAPFVGEGGVITSSHIPSDEPDRQNGLLVDDDEETQVFVPSHAPPTFPAQSLRPSEAPGERSSSIPPHSRVDTERRRIVHALEQCAGNQTRAAKLLGVSRRTLVNRLERLSVPRPKKPFA